MVAHNFLIFSNKICQYRCPREINTIFADFEFIDKLVCSFSKCDSIKFRFDFFFDFKILKFFGKVNCLAIIPKSFNKIYFARTKNKCF